MSRHDQDVDWVDYHDWQESVLQDRLEEQRESRKRVERRDILEL